MTKRYNKRLHEWDYLKLVELGEALDRTIGPPSENLELCPDSTRLLNSVIEEAREEILKSWAIFLTDTPLHQTKYWSEPSYYRSTLEFRGYKVEDLHEHGRGDDIEIIQNWYWHIQEGLEYWLERDREQNLRDLVNGEWEEYTHKIEEFRVKKYYWKTREITKELYDLAKERLKQRIDLLKQKEQTLPIRNKIYTLEKRREKYTQAWKWRIDDVIFYDERLPLTEDDWDDMAEWHGLWNEVNGYDMETILNVWDEIDDEWRIIYEEDEGIIQLYQDLYEKEPTTATFMILPKIRKIMKNKRLHYSERLTEIRDLIQEKYDDLTAEDW